MNTQLINGYMDPCGATSTWRARRNMPTITKQSLKSSYITQNDPAITEGVYTFEMPCVVGKHDGDPFNQTQDTLFRSAVQIHPYVNRPIIKSRLLRSEDQSTNPIAGTNYLQASLISRAGAPLNYSICDQSDIVDRLLAQKVSAKNPLSPEFALGIHAKSLQLATPNPQDDKRFNQGILSPIDLSVPKIANDNYKKILEDRNKLLANAPGSTSATTPSIDPNGVSNPMDSSDNTPTGYTPNYAPKPVSHEAHTAIPLSLTRTSTTAYPGQYTQQPPPDRDVAGINGPNNNQFTGNLINAYLRESDPIIYEHIRKHGAKSALQIGYENRTQYLSDAQKEEYRQIIRNHPHYVEGPFGSSMQTFAQQLEIAVDKQIMPFASIESLPMNVSHRSLHLHLYQHLFGIPLPGDTVHANSLLQSELTHFTGYGPPTPLPEGKSMFLSHSF
jgi:hypothetical protein